MIGCTDLNIPKGESDCEFVISMVDLNNTPISNRTFNGTVDVSIGIGGEYFQIPVLTQGNDTTLNAYFKDDSVFIVFPKASQKHGEVFYSFLLSGVFKLSDNHGAKLVNYETVATKLCNFI